MSPRPAGRGERPLEALGSVLPGTAVPYGYTLTVLSSHSILSHSHGAPGTIDVLLFVLGAILAFATLGLVARRIAPRPVRPRQADLVRAGMVHGFAIGAAFGASVLIGLIPGAIAWLLAAFAATTLYLSIASAEIDFAHRLDEER